MRPTLRRYVDDRSRRPAPAGVRTPALAGRPRRRASRRAGRAQPARRRVRSGRWVASRRRRVPTGGCAVVVGSPAARPILAIGGRAVASHFAAAALHGIPGFGRGAPEISDPARARAPTDRHHGPHQHRPRPLPRCVAVDGIPVRTSPARSSTSVDASVTRRLLRAIEWVADEQARTDWPALIAHARPPRPAGRPGIRRLRRVIVGEHAIETRSPTATSSCWCWRSSREAGLPEPVLHHRVFDGERFVAEVDLAYPALQDRHRARRRRPPASADVRERDLPRQNDLVLAGWIVLRFTWRAVPRTDPEQRHRRDPGRHRGQRARAA